MPESFRLLSELESAEIAEVSVETIRKYRDCGLLDPVVKDNQTYFQEVDIRALFFTKKDKTTQASSSISAQTETQSQESENSDNWTINNPNFFSASEQRAEFNEVLGQPSPQAALNTSTVVVSEASQTVNQESAASAGSGLDKAETSVSSQASSAQISAPSSAKTSTETDILAERDFAANISGTTYQFDRDEPEHIQQSQTSLDTASQTRHDDTVDSRPRAPFFGESAVFAEPGATELIDMNKSLRDQIQLLREERDWLRERIEKLEARSEREQMLLLSESENLRNMIGYNKKSFWQKALPWFMGTSDRKD